MAQPRERSPHDWAAPPGAPVHYPLTAHLADIYHGRRDGHKGIPQVSLPPQPPDEQDGEDPDGLHAGNGEPRPRHAAPNGDSEPIGTPHLLKLRALANDQMSQERVSWLADIAPVRHELAEFSAQVAALKGELEAAREKREMAAQMPGDEDLKERRTAEQDSQTRPDRLVRDRRMSEHRRRHSEAEQAWLSATARLAQAEEAVQARNRQLVRRAAVARARAHRIYEHAWHRVATYWQQLVRVHPLGPHLNSGLRPVGPELPEWARGPDTPADE